jgi:hypothetical protein
VEFTTPITTNLTLYAHWSLTDPAGAGDSDADAGGAAPVAPPAPRGSGLAATGSNVDPWPLFGLASLVIALGLGLLTTQRVRGPRKMTRVE